MWWCSTGLGLYTHCGFRSAKQEAWNVLSDENFVVKNISEYLQKLLLFDTVSESTYHEAQGASYMW